MPTYPANSSLPSFAKAYGEPLSSAVLKTHCEDFRVDETLSFEFDGVGEHVLLRVEKRDLNTHDVVRELQAIAKLKPVAIGYCGLKDKRAITRQWFSVHCGVNSNPDWGALPTQGITVLEQTRHSKKLRIGTHQQNRFDICLRGLTAEPDELAQRLAQIAKKGFPNYFGEQRFGINGSNLAAATAMFKRLKAKAGAEAEGGPKKRFKPRRKDQMPLSAARSLLFNSILSQRVTDRSWDKALPGEVCQFDDGSSVFRAGADESLEHRIEAGEIHGTAALFGTGGVQPSEQAGQLEQGVLEQHPLYAAGLENAGMSGARRSLRALPRDLQWQYSDSILRLQFNLKRGSYATSLIREIVQATVP